MPRIKASPKKCIKTNIQEPHNSWVIVLKGEALVLPEKHMGSGIPDIVNLRHPNTGESAAFLFSAANNSIQEVLTLNKGKRSWFIDDSVKSDGNMNLSTPIDPMFLVLPYLKKYCTSQAIPLEHLLQDKDFPETARLLKSDGLKYLSMISDKKGDEELNAFKYNEEKTLSWLKKKTERVAAILQQKNIHVASDAAVSSTFIKHSKDVEDNDAYLRYAHGIVSEYLMDDLSRKLFDYLNFNEDQHQDLQSLKRKSLMVPSSDAKKMKIEEGSNTTSSVLDLRKLNAKPSKSAMTLSKEKARLKAASGSKTISSFFKVT